MKVIHFKLGDILKEKMEKENYTQKELANKIGIRQNTLIDLMKNDQSRFYVETLNKVVDALGIKDIKEIMHIVEVEDDS
jgi:DNA-binding helix-turn-helix protein